MPVFSYRGMTPAGRTRGGVIGAESARAAWQELKLRGLYPTDVREQAAGDTRRAGRLAPGELAAAMRQLATLVEAGLPLAEALMAVTEQAEHPALVRALTIAHARLREGEPFADALAASPTVFPPLFEDLVRAGEASGALPAVLTRLADHTESAAALRSRIRSALTYPAVMIAASSAVLGFLLLWVVPQVTALFVETGTPLPFATRALLVVSRAVAIAWWPVVLAVPVMIWAGRRWFATPAMRVRLDAFLLSLPLAGPLLRKAAAARVARTLAMLLTGGVPLDGALAIAGAGAGNRHIAEAVAAARTAVREGEALAPALRATGVFPPLVPRVAAVGERGAALAPLLERVATLYEREVEAGVTALTAFIEPALVVVMGAVVLALVMAVLLPLFDLSGLVR